VFAIADYDVFFWWGTYVFMYMHYLRADLALVSGWLAARLRRTPAACSCTP
jgi:hypothetical protein